MLFGLYLEYSNVPGKGSDGKGKGIAEE